MWKVIKIAFGLGYECFKWIGIIFLVSTTFDMDHPNVHKIFLMYGTNPYDFSWKWGSISFAICVVVGLFVLASKNSE